jgi:hypothetical protein
VTLTERGHPCPQSVRSTLQFFFVINNQTDKFALCAHAAGMPALQQSAPLTILLSLNCLWLTMTALLLPIQVSTICISRWIIEILNDEFDPSAYPDGTDIYVKG